MDRESCKKRFIFDGRKGRHRTCRPTRAQLVDGKTTPLVLAPATLHLDEVDLDHVAILARPTDRRPTVKIQIRMIRRLRLIEGGMTLIVGHLLPILLLVVHAAMNLIV